jgi:molybdopterin/thiamine biosynthesis adenylyltransferase/proteasome lid subunit RPN8/RPN11
MKTRITFRYETLEELRAILFAAPDVEGAAFVLCGESRSDDGAKLIAHSIHPIAEEDYLRREFDGLSIASRALMRIAKIARRKNLSILFAHSHPGGFAEFSRQDDKEEGLLLPFLQSRVPGRIHGTIVMTPTFVFGRLYCPQRVQVEGIVSVGERIRVWPNSQMEEVPTFVDRQVRAFGMESQKQLGTLRIGVVGLGGTGSPVAEQLYRLGVGELTLVDGEKLDVTNLNRVYGSRSADVGKPKVAIAKRHLDEIGLGISVRAVPFHITEEHAIKALRDCDIVFGCTDKELPRAILTRLALRYLIPYFDLGVLIDSTHGHLTGIYGRVTTFLPGEACLFCRGRITPEALRIESLSADDRRKQVKEGYAPELDETAPAVISFTSTVAGLAVTEFLNRVVGIMSADRHPSEILAILDSLEIHTNRVAPKATCACTIRDDWGRGDETPFLGLSWPDASSEDGALSVEMTNRS